MLGNNVGKLEGEAIQNCPARYSWPFASWLENAAHSLASRVKLMKKTVG